MVKNTLDSLLVTSLPQLDITETQFNKLTRYTGTHLLVAMSHFRSSNSLKALLLEEEQPYNYEQLIISEPLLLAPVQQIRISYKHLCQPRCVNNLPHLNGSWHTGFLQLSCPHLKQISHLSEKTQSSHAICFMNLLPFTHTTALNYMQVLHCE